MDKRDAMKVQGIDISLLSINNNDYICLTDMVKAKKDDVRAADIIKNWIRTRSTIEFLGTWESLYNPNFKVVEFDHFKKEAGLPTFTMSVNNWVEKTNAIGIFSKNGRYGGTYAHKDIAFEFGGAISPAFKLYIVKEYQRLKEIESNRYGLEWNVKRILSKANYHIHTEAIKNYIIPKTGYSKEKEWLLYADEADMLNVIVFGCTAKDWKESNMDKAMHGENIRDMASINDLAIISNLESINSILIKKGVNRKDRFRYLYKIKNEQKKSLDKFDFIKAVKKESPTTYIDIQESNTISSYDKNSKVMGYNPKNKNEEK